MNRRTFLLGSVPICAGVAGCSTIFSDPSMISLTFFNQSDSPYTLEIALLRSDEDSSRGEAEVFSERIDIEADGQATREDVAEAQPYIVEYDLYESNSTLTDEDHVHYFPGDEDAEGGLAFDIDSAGVLTRRW